jgi:hypothetical protein
MKKIKFIISVILLTVSSVVLSQTEKTYPIDVQGNIPEKKVNTKEVQLCFESDVPELTDQQVSQLQKDGKIQVSEKKIKGRYEQGILFYVPRVEADSCFLKDNIVSYQGYSQKNESRMFSWWYLSIFLSIFFMIMIQITFYECVSLRESFYAFISFRIYVAFFVLSLLFAIAFVFFHVFVFFCTLSFIFACGCILFMILFLIMLINGILNGKFTKKRLITLIIIYYVWMIANCILFYLQI